ncbi:MAG TPA: hypothetical protein VHG28_23290, partial [Longimicrobiaceae bacterium]|nr:hypothetical protein [Longimicrobiaceae bacterium]
MTRSGIALLLLLPAAACTPGARASPPAGPAPAPDPYEACGSREDAEVCAAEVERAALARSGGRARRSGGRLEIAAAGGRVIPLANDTTEGERYVRYRYREYLEEIGYHLVEVGFYEGGGFVLVSAATGDETHLHGSPVVSPDRARFVAVSVDLVAGYDPNGIQVWRLTGAGPRLEWGVDG